MSSVFMLEGIGRWGATGLLSVFKLVGWELYLKKGIGPGRG